MVHATCRIGDEGRAEMSNSLPKAEYLRKDDGTVLLCHERRDVPVVSVLLRIPGGNLYNPLDRPGLAALATDLVGEGPVGTTPMEWRRITEKLAAEIEFDSGPDYSTIRFSCLSENLGELCNLTRRAIEEPGLPRSEWKQIVKTMRASLREHWAQPSSVSNHLSAVQSLGYSHPLAHAPFEKALAKATLEQGVAVAGQVLQKQNGTCGMIGGDIDSEDGFKYLSELVGALREITIPVDDAPEPKPSAARIWIADNRKVDQVFFTLSRRGICAGDPDRIALRLANYMTGGGAFESRLMDKVREEAGGTYGIHSRLQEQRLETPFKISSFTKVERLGEMLGIVDQTLKEIVEQGFTEDELKTARGNLYGALPLRLTSPSAILDWVAAGIRAGLDQDALEQDWHAYETMPLEKVNAAARRVIGDGEFRKTFVGPAQEIQRQVSAAGGVEIFPFKTMPDKWPHAMISER